MSLNGNTKVIVQAIAIVGALMGLGAWLRADIISNTRRAELNTAAINNINISLEKINGKQDTMIETLKWLQKIQDEYLKVNKSMNIEDFMKSLVNINNKSSFK